jgi:hypothetical protein
VIDVLLPEVIRRLNAIIWGGGAESAVKIAQLLGLVESERKHLDAQPGRRAQDPDEDAGPSPRRIAT